MLLPVAGLVTKVASLLAKKAAQLAATRVVHVPKILEVAKGVNETRKIVNDLRSRKPSGGEEQTPDEKEEG